MRGFLVLLAILLVGYTYLGKGFAYWSIGPVFVGEMVLIFGVLTLILQWKVVSIPTVPVTLAIGVFIAWGTVRTAVDVGEYGIDAVRDAVVWGYSVFAILVAVALLSSGDLLHALTFYRRFVIWFLCIVPVGYVIFRKVEQFLPTVPGSEVPIILLKSGDIAAQLGGAAAFMLLGLHDVFRDNRKPYSRIIEGFLWSIMGLGFVVVASNRGGLLAVVAAICVVTFFSPSRRLGIFSIGVFVCMALSIIVDLNIELGDDRNISVTQIFLNLNSIFFDSNTPYTLTGTISWRLEWWQRIVDYTIFGDYFWFGKGFGVNLAVSDGATLGWLDDSLRSPHNAAMTFLGRGGVPGLALWSLINILFVASLYAAFRRAKNAGEIILARINVWLIAYWASFIVNMSFDVYLEGPQGGIWFWSVIGAGIAFAEHQRRMFAAPEFRPEPASSVPAAGE